MGFPPVVHKDYVCTQCRKVMRAGEFLEEHEAERNRLCSNCFFDFRTNAKCAGCGLIGCTVQEEGGWWHHKCWYDGDIYFNRAADYAAANAKKLLSEGGFISGQVLSWGVVFGMDFDTEEQRKRFYASPQFAEVMELFVGACRKAWEERSARKMKQAEEQSR